MAIPCLKESPASLDNPRCRPLPANLIQARRDFFRSHAHDHLDKQETSHGCRDEV